LGGRRRPVLPTLAAVDDLIANVIIAVHPIAHDFGTPSHARLEDH